MALARRIIASKLGIPAGSATIGVVVRDSGGAANRGVDTSAIITFTIAGWPLYQVYLPRI